MNKGLELIEAVWLFGLPPEKIQIVVQRQSIVHSAVQFSDNSVIAQLGVPDMRIPIQYALTYPKRVPGVVPELDFAALKVLLRCGRRRDLPLPCRLQKGHQKGRSRPMCRQRCQ